jgi:hypothetical protein
MGEKAFGKSDGFVEAVIGWMGDEVLMMRWLDHDLEGEKRWMDELMRVYCC